MRLLSTSTRSYVAATLALALSACVSELSNEPHNVESSQGEAPSGSVVIPNIVGGQPVPAGRFPYMVRLDIPFAVGSGVCSGTLVSPDWVLTAAHCFQKPNGSFVTPAEYTAVAGIRIHPQFQRVTVGTSVSFNFDVALVRLRSPFGGRLNYPRLPDGRRATAPGSFGDAVGYGKTSDRSPTQQVPFTKPMATLSDGSCRALDFVPSFLPESRKATLLCAESTANDVSSDTCGGDSGGPLVGRDARGADIIRGVLSYGPSNSNGGCENIVSSGRPLPSVYADLADPQIARFVYDTINPRFVSYARLTRLNNVAAPVPGEVVGGIPLARIFDEAYYLRHNPDVGAAVASGGLPSAYVHFVVAGRFEGRNPSVLYNENYYLGENRDVAEAVANGQLQSGLVHFLTFGHLENRAASPFFDVRDYLARYPDIANAVASGAIRSAFLHYVTAGLEEGRAPLLSPYAEQFYLRNNADIAAAVAAGSFPDGYAHFVQFGQPEGRPASPLFAEQAYRTANPDVAAAIAGGALASGFSHYVRFGRYEFRPPR